jgi:hypothetical protein
MSKTIGGRTHRIVDRAESDLEQGRFHLVEEVERESTILERQELERSDRIASRDDRDERDEYEERNER